MNELKETKDPELGKRDTKDEDKNLKDSPRSIGLLVEKLNRASSSVAK